MVMKSYLNRSSMEFKGKHMAFKWISNSLSMVGKLRVARHGDVLQIAARRSGGHLQAQRS